MAHISIIQLCEMSQEPSGPGAVFQETELRPRAIFLYLAEYSKAPVQSVFESDADSSNDERKTLQALA